MASESYLNGWGSLETHVAMTIEQMSIYTSEDKGNSISSGRIVTVTNDGFLELCAKFEAEHPGKIAAHLASPNGKRPGMAKKRKQAEERRILERFKKEIGVS